MTHHVSDIRLHFNTRRTITGSFSFCKNFCCLYRDSLCTSTTLKWPCSCKHPYIIDSLTAFSTVSREKIKYLVSLHLSPLLNYSSAQVVYRLAGFVLVCFLSCYWDGSSFLGLILVFLMVNLQYLWVFFLIDLFRLFLIPCSSLGWDECCVWGSLRRDT